MLGVALWPRDSLYVFATTASNDTVPKYSKSYSKNNKRLNLSEKI